MKASENRVDLFTPKYLEDSRKAGLFESSQIPDLMEFVGAEDRMRILDVGTGLGYLIELIDGSAGDCVICGIDIREDLIDHARKIITSKKNQLSFDIGDCHKLPYEDNSFDIVTCLTLLMHVSHPQRALEEMKRVCKDGGAIIAIESMPVYTSMTRYMVDLSGETVDAATNLLRRELEETKPENSDYEIALKLPRHLIDMNLEQVKAKAYSRISIDNGMTIEQQRENAEMILANPSNQKWCNFMFSVQPERPNRPQDEKLKAVNQAMADRAESILRDSRFSRGTGDTQLKTMIAVRGVCKKTALNTSSTTTS